MKSHRIMRKRNSWSSYLKWYNHQKSMAVYPSTIPVLRARLMAKSEEDYTYAKALFHRHFQAYMRAVELKLHAFKPSH